jgi:hypothetical protein
MPRGPIAERLRRFVRDRLELDERGTAAALAARLRKPQSWVTEYVAQKPKRHAGLDASIEICRFFQERGFKISIDALSAGAITRDEHADAVVEFRERYPRLSEDQRELILGALRQFDSQGPAAASDRTAARARTARQSR